MNEALPDLVARFRIRQGLFRKELVEAALYELDGYGCVMKTDKVFNPGDTVVLDPKSSHSSHVVPQAPFPVSGKWPDSDFSLKPVRKETIHGEESQTER